MIFGSVIRRAEHAVENIVEQALARVIVAIPLLVAAGFATAAGSQFLNAKYGPEWGHLIMAGVFAGLGLVAAIVVSAKSSVKPDVQAAVDRATDQTEALDATAGEPAPSLTSSERELVNAMLASAAPIAVPGLLRLLLRNIPIVLALLAAIFVMTRKAEDAAPVPAENAASS